MDEIKRRYWIKGFHPESDSEWFEDETFNLKNNAFDYMFDLPDIDNGHGYRVIWDSWTNEIVSKRW